MKKYFYILMLAFSFLEYGFPISSYYGLNGLHFIPAARTEEAGVCEIAVSSLPNPASDLNIYPYSFRGYWTVSQGLEIALTNTFQYYFSYDPDSSPLFPVPGNGNGYIAQYANMVVPIIPSVKLAFVDKAVTNGSLAVGVEYPYGVFLLFDYILVFGADFSLYSVVGLSTTVSALYALGGVKIDFPIPIALTIEGAYGGKTELLTSPQEAFAAIGLLYRITDNMNLDFIFRVDADAVRRLSFGFNVKF